MKKLFLLVFLTILLSNCQEELDLKTASISELQMYLGENLNYQKFIDSHINNMKSIHSLSESEVDSFNDLMKKIHSQEDIIYNTQKLHNLIEFETKTFEYLDNFTSELNAKFIFDESDLIKVIQISIEDRISVLSANSKVAEIFSYADGCGVYCGIRSAGYEAGLLYNGVDAGYASAARSGYYLGCLDGCLHPQSN